VRLLTRQPVPESKFASDAKSGVPQPAHTNAPRRFSFSSGLQREARQAMQRTQWRSAWRAS
jgi:hypothetical protein